MDVTKTIEAVLDELGVKRSHLGYAYLVCGIRCAQATPGSRLRLTTDLYPSIAADLGSSRWQNVERCIRYTVMHTFEYGNLDALTKLFGDIVSLDTGLTTPGRFISICAVEVGRRIRAQYAGST